MATDLRNESIPYSGSITLNANNVAFELWLPRGATQIIVQPDTDDIRVAYDGTEGVALTGGVLHVGDQSVEYTIEKEWPNRQELPTPKMWLQTSSQPTTVNVQLVR